MEVNTIDKQEKQLKSIADSLDKLVKLKQKELKALVYTNHNSTSLSSSDPEQMKEMTDFMNGDTPER